MKKITTKSNKSAKAAAAPPSIASVPARPAPAKKPAAKATSTKITAQIDVGFGNTLYVRGEGPGLSWDRGLPMDCVADDEWTITLSDASVPVVFKFLLNDLTWCVGNDYVVEPGGTAAVVPSF
jgi:hypothetical protein